MTWYCPACGDPITQQNDIKQSHRCKNCKINWWKKTIEDRPQDFKAGGRNPLQ